MSCVFLLSTLTKQRLTLIPLCYGNCSYSTPPTLANNLVRIPSTLNVLYHEGVRALQNQLVTNPAPVLTGISTPNLCHS